jgi:hypothetical protein
VLKTFLNAPAAEFGSFLSGIDGVAPVDQPAEHRADEADAVDLESEKEDDEEEEEREGDGEGDGDGNGGGGDGEGGGEEGAAPPKPRRAQVAERACTPADWAALPNANAYEFDPRFLRTTSPK